jgi:AcrR family transcriptional regulator
VTNAAPAQRRRADAQRNYCALVLAARDVFGERGIDAPLDEIAQRAGIGNATLYRHFPTRCELIVAVFTEQMQAYADAARQAAEADDAWAGLRDYVRTICAIQASNRGLADLLTNSQLNDDTLLTLRRSAHRDLTRVIRRAKREGSLRADFRTQDVALILMANAGVVRYTADIAPGSSERLVALILDGLAASAATEGPPSPKERHILAALGGNP